MTTGLSKARAKKALRVRQPVELLDVVVYTFLTFFMLIVLYPFYNAILVSMVPQRDYVRSPFMIWPTSFDWSNYIFVFNSPLLLRSMGTSASLMVVGTVYNMLLTVLFAYAMTRPIPGRRFFRFLMIFTMYFQGGLVPLYLLIKALGMLDTFMVMFLPSVISIPYMLIISNSMSSIPLELTESALLDGAGEMRILFHIILPLSLPILATFTLYYAVERWNEWYSALLFIKDQEKWPLQYALRKIINDINFMAQNNVAGQNQMPNYTDGIKMACIVVTVFPLIAIYPFLQRYFLSGLTAGAVKG